MSHSDTRTQDHAETDAVLDRAQERQRAALDHTVILPRPWREPADTVELAVRYSWRGDGGRLAAEVAGHRLHLDEPVRLAPAMVAKPWGREIWLTGIEARGESTVLTGQGELPLSWYLALAPRRLTGRAPLVLLKILDPRPEPVLGDLYFEVHEKKQEVYVVSHVDPSAWPDGRGRIRFGMNQTLRRRYGDDEAFRRDYLAAVQRYERVRRAIDQGEAVAADEERRLRHHMESFTDMRELAVGDVVTVPTWLPHSLQHGVRVVEFQTPTYERYIISFAQRVLTQDHWDSPEAVARMRLDAPPPPRFERLGDGMERIVSFDDFSVARLRLPAGASCAVPDHPSYLLCMVVDGQVRLGPLDLTEEQAAFVPAAALADPAPGQPAAVRLANTGAGTATVLLAAPDL